MAAPDPPGFDDGFRAKFKELLIWRRDVRRFRSDPLPDGAVERLLHVACLAPSVGLCQPWRFVLIEDAARRTEIRANFLEANRDALASYHGDRAARYAALKLSGLDDAPVHLAVFVEPDPGQGANLGRKTMPETVAYSAVTAIHTLWLAARAEGIGMGWVSILDPALVNRCLDVPAHWQLIGYFCLGYPGVEQDTPELERMRWETRIDPARIIFRR